jgi:hypothetical protein
VSASVSPPGASRRPGADVAGSGKKIRLSGHAWDLDLGDTNA